MTKTYLGDGVYAWYDGYHIWLTTENGIEITNRIALDPHVLRSFELWVIKLREELAACR